MFVVKINTESGEKIVSMMDDEAHGSSFDAIAVAALVLNLGWYDDFRVMEVMELSDELWDAHATGLNVEGDAITVQAAATL